MTPIHSVCYVCPAGHVSVGNGGQMATAEEKKDDVIGTVEWSTATVETPEKRDSAEISGKHSESHVSVLLIKPHSYVYEGGIHRHHES